MIVWSFTANSYAFVSWKINVKLLSRSVAARWWHRIDDYIVNMYDVISFARVKNLLSVYQGEIPLTESAIHFRSIVPHMVLR